MTKPIVIDLFAGLGGASEAFVGPDYEVYRFDNNPLLEDVPHMIHMDLSKQDVWHWLLRPELLIMAPPCTEFSLAYAAPGPTATRAGKIHVPDMSLLEACIEHRDRLLPKYWIIENVAGSIPFFHPYLGQPTQIIGPFVLWHNCPHLVLPKHKLQAIRGHKAANDTQRWSPLRANYKAKWPQTLSVALRRSIEQPTLLRWS